MLIGLSCMCYMPWMVKEQCEAYCIPGGRFGKLFFTPNSVNGRTQRKFQSKFPL